MHASTTWRAVPWLFSQAKGNGRAVKCTLTGERTKSPVEGREENRKALEIVYIVRRKTHLGSNKHVGSRDIHPWGWDTKWASAHV